MNKIYVYIIALMIVLPLSAEIVYKKVNPDGSVEFTDREIKNSKEIKVRKPVTYKPLRLPPLSRPRTKKSAAGYSISITQPIADATFTNKTDVQVAITLVPALSPAYKIRYQLDGQLIENKSTSTIFRNVNRGTHNLSVSVIDSNGSVVGETASSTFHMKRFFKKPSQPKPKKP